MTPVLYIFEADSIPDEFNGDEGVILLDKGFEGRDEDAPISMDEVSFLISKTVLSKRPEVVLEGFIEWWKEGCGGSIRFQELTADISQVKALRDKELKNLSEDGWSIKANFVAICTSSEEARRDAIEIIRKSELKFH